MRHLIIPILAGGLILGLYSTTREAPTAPSQQEIADLPPAGPSPFRLAGGATTVSVTPASAPLENGSPATASGPARLAPANLAPIYDPQGNLVGYAPDPWLQAGAAPTGGPVNVLLPGTESGPDLNAMPLPYLPISDFGEILRFDLSPATVRQRWARVSATPSEPGWLGLRVALVTGTQNWDLHGALTYHFDDQQRCRRIAFRGWTGNPQRLLEFLQSTYRFRAMPTHLAGAWIAGRDAWPSSGILIKRPLASAEPADHRQFAIWLELSPGQSWWDSSTPLSREFFSQLEQARQTP